MKEIKKEIKKTTNYNYKKDFPIFDNNKWLVYLDNTATTQKPAYVIQWIKNLLEASYSNIHRWMYSISEQTEDLYNDSKKIIAK